MKEIFQRTYDNPFLEDGSFKPNKSLGFFDILETLEEGTYNSIKIGVTEDRRAYLLLETEVSGNNGGTRTRVLEIKNVSIIA